MFSPVFHLWIIKCHSNTKKMRYYLLISDKYKGFKLANRKSQLNLKALYYSIVGGLGPAPSDALRQVGHSIPLGILAEARAYFDLTHT